MSILRSEAEQVRALHSKWVKHYRPIGSGAIAAAVAALKRKTVDRSAVKPPAQPAASANVRRHALNKPAQNRVSIWLR